MPRAEASVDRRVCDPGRRPSRVEPVSVPRVSRAALRAARAPSRRRARRRAGGRAPCSAPTRGSRRADWSSGRSRSPAAFAAAFERSRKAFHVGSMIHSGSESGPDHSATPCSASHSGDTATTSPSCPATARDASSQSANVTRSPTALKAPVRRCSIASSVNRTRSSTWIACTAAVEDVGHEHRLVVARGPRDPVAAAARGVAGSRDESRAARRAVDRRAPRGRRARSPTSPRRRCRASTRRTRAAA